jgi:beta-barrel assembly-enhancing protease
MRNIAIACATLAAAACASPQTSRPVVASAELAAEQQRQSLFVLESRAEEYRRVYDIAERLYLANTELCARTAPRIGIMFENLNDYGRDFREAARSLWGVSDRPSISWIAEQSPAAAAGLQVRDQLVSVNGRAIQPGRRSSRQASELLREATEGGRVTLQVQRGVETLTVPISPQTSCAYQFLLVDGDELNAAADGRTIILNRGMLRFVRSDDELALVLGHELAHNAMRHIESMQTNAMMGTIGGAMLDVLAAAGGVNTGGAFADAGGDMGRMMFSRDFESEADYVGLYFTARAGFDINSAEQFWRRMAAEHPRGIRLAYTHPNTAERYLGLAATRAEIVQKLAAGQPLRPNMRGDHAATPQPTSAIATPASPAPVPTSTVEAPEEQAPVPTPDAGSPTPEPEPAPPSNEAMSAAPT